MNSSTQAVLIGSTDVANLFQTFGFRTFSVDTNPLSDVLSILKKDSKTISIILITSNITLTPKQETFLQSLDIPLLTIPVQQNEGDIAHKKFEKLIEKAVGMKLDFLQE